MSPSVKAINHSSILLCSLGFVNIYLAPLMEFMVVSLSWEHSSTSRALTLGAVFVKEDPSLFGNICFVFPLTFVGTSTQNPNRSYNGHLNMSSCCPQNMFVREVVCWLI